MHLSVIHQHVPNVSNVSKPTAHRIDTVWVTFPKRFHTACERLPVCQMSIQRMPNVYVTCKYRAQRVCSDRPAVFYRATSVRLPFFPPLWRHDDSIKAPTPAFSLLGIKFNANFYCNTYFWTYVLHSIMAYSLCVSRRNTTCLDKYHFAKWQTFHLKSQLHRDSYFSSSDFSVFAINKDPFYYLHLLTNYFIWKYYVFHIQYLKIIVVIPDVCMCSSALWNRWENVTFGLFENG